QDFQDRILAIDKFVFTIFFDPFHLLRSFGTLPTLIHNIHSNTLNKKGSDNVESRRKLWSERQIFFITPQILKNDCCNRIVDGSSFKCIIFDEAHKATGNHPYCQ
ncbi:MAG: hypothetical protein MHMPM18_004629, partial [Marteilia pararefringens]